MVYRVGLRELSAGAVEADGDTAGGDLEAGGDFLAGEVLAEEEEQGHAQAGAHGGERLAHGVGFDNLGGEIGAGRLPRIRLGAGRARAGRCAARLSRQAFEAMR